MRFPVGVFLVFVLQCSSQHGGFVTTTLDGGPPQVGDAATVYDAATFGDVSVPDAAPPPQIWTDYWLLGQLAKQTTVFLYSKNGATVTFSGTNATPVSVAVPANTFVSYNAGSLGYDAQLDTDWYFLEAKGDADFMMSADRVIETYGTFHGDRLHAKPGHGLSTTHYIAWAESSPLDDEIVLYAPQKTTVDIEALLTDGSVVNQTKTIIGLDVEPLTLLPLGYSLKITSKHPIAAASFDEQPSSAQNSMGSGYYFAGQGQTELFTEYMHLHYDKAHTYHSLYAPQGTSLSYYDGQNSLVDTQKTSAPLSEMLWHTDVGYSTSVFPYLVHYTSTTGVGDSYVTPTSTDVRAWASYMGYDASHAQLEIYAPQTATVLVYDGRDSQKAGTTLTVPAGTIYHAMLDASLGFAPGQPFLVAVSSDVPVYQEVRIPNFLRQYPGEIGPPLPK